MMGQIPRGIGGFEAQPDVTKWVEVRWGCESHRCTVGVLLTSPPLRNPVTSLTLLF